MRRNAVLEKASMHCSYGPEDYRERLSTLPEKGGKMRVKRKDMGLSVKRGCKAHFTYSVHPRTPDIAEIRYFETEHLNHGPAEKVMEHSIVSLSAYPLCMQKMPWPQSFTSRSSAARKDAVHVARQFG